MKLSSVTTVNAPAFNKVNVTDKAVQRTDRQEAPISQAWKTVALARKKGRATTLDYIEKVFEAFIELHGDRGYKDDAAIVGGIGIFEGKPVTVIGHQKGRDVGENIKRNFGMPHPEGYRKALRLMKQAEKFGRPIICLIDTPGAFCGLGAEERGQGEAIARNLFEMAQLEVPVIAFVIGEGGSGGALALGVGNHIYMLERAIYSVLSPEGFASILWKDASRASEAAELMKITAGDLLQYKLIDGIVKENEENPEFVFEQMRIAIQNSLSELDSLSAAELVDHRANKFRQMGV